MSDEDKEKTAFSTSRGLFQFRRMPFGLVNAGATYCRMMRKLLDGIPCVDHGRRSVGDSISLVGTT